MAAFRQVRKLCSPLLSGSIKQCERAFSAAAVAMQDFEYWELPLPVLQDTHGQSTGRGPQWVFLGTSGVKKSSYAGRLAKLLDVPHISMGSLLRKEASLDNPLAKELANMMNQGMLIPDEVVFSVLSKRLEQKIELEGSGFILDGFPRTINQAEVLDQVAEIDLVVNMKLRNTMLARQMDRDGCSECECSLDANQTKTGHCPKCTVIGSFDVTMASIHENLVRERQQLQLSQPVEHYYRRQGKLLEFEVMGGIQRTWPRLLSVLQLRDNEVIMQQELPM
ncbi:hypothetical protein KP509_29G052600 [Ceratopteris richardii]|uniref:adenylate kinase n=1 Tax=Ceratopteris richardii TaxID=49495 RepID=A0A8T2R8N4_CERRI|nr:hypothetical protein KP509_29G052600 [Ceratopteris richardii]